MRPGVTDVSYETRATELTEAWAFVMEKLEGKELLNIAIVAQDWRLDESEDWVETYLVTVQIREDVSP